MRCIRAAYALGVDSNHSYVRAKGPCLSSARLSVCLAPSQRSECACRSEKVEKADEAYFDSYGYFDIHRTMLGDKVRC